MQSYPTLKLGVSACLIGQRVRYDGDDQTDHFCSSQLAAFVQWLPECPEMAIGLGVPRPTIQLINTPGHSPNRRAIQNSEPKRDITDALSNRADNFLKANPDCDGYLLMEKSPSCGLTQTKLFNEQGELLGRISQGLFAERLLALKPQLPVIEAARLTNPLVRHQFLSYLFAYRELNDFFAQMPTAAQLQQRWQHYKLLVLAHDEKRYRQLGPLVAQTDCRNTDQLQALLQLWLQAIQQPASQGGYLNALHHAAGMVKKKADLAAYQALVALISAYSHGEATLWQALTMLEEVSTPAPYIYEQRLLNVYPRSLRPD